jgi:hypothetical protein
MARSFLESRKNGSSKLLFWLRSTGPVLLRPMDLFGVSMVHGMVRFRSLTMRAIAISIASRYAHRSGTSFDDVVYRDPMVFIGSRHDLIIVFSNIEINLCIGNGGVLGDHHWG